MGGGRIDAYVDIASTFTYIAFLDLLNNKKNLEANGVQVEFHPVFLGGMNNLSGNKPPWTLAAKAKYLAYDGKRAASRVGLTNYSVPEDLFVNGKTISPMRAMLYIKKYYPKETFESAFYFLLYKFWTPPNTNLVDEGNLAAALAEATETPTSGKKLFTEADVKRIMEGRAEMKDVLSQQTKMAVEELGAFGCPWFWVTNSKGESQPFFGSDRFNHIYKYLDISFQDIKALPPGVAPKL